MMPLVCNFVFYVSSFIFLDFLNFFEFFGIYCNFLNDCLFYRRFDLLKKTADEISKETGNIVRDTSHLNLS